MAGRRLIQASEIDLYSDFNAQGPWPGRSYVSFDNTTAPLPNPQWINVSTPNDVSVAGPSQYLYLTGGTVLSIPILPQNNLINGANALTTATIDAVSPYLIDVVGTPGLYIVTLNCNVSIPLAATGPVTLILEANNPANGFNTVSQQSLTSPLGSSVNAVNLTLTYPVGPGVALFNVFGNIVNSSGQTIDVNAIQITICKPF